MFAVLFPARLLRRARRLGDDRGGPAALDGLWPVANGGFGLAVAHWGDVPVSLAGYMIVYLLCSRRARAIVRIVGRGPAEPETEPEIESGRPR